MLSSRPTPIAWNVESGGYRIRWDLCARIAEELVGGPDADPAEVWRLALALQL